MKIQSDILDFFFRNPLDPLFLVPRVIEDSRHPIYDQLNDQLNNIDKSEIIEIKSDRKFQFLNSNLEKKELDNVAREWWLIKELQKLIPQKRLALLKEQYKVDRPPPYCHKSLSDLEIASDFLVEMNSFEIEGNSLIRNEYGFTLTLPREQSNSQTWIFNALKRIDTSDIFIRPDPLMYGKKESFSVPEYKMLVYGTPLDWEGILTSKIDIHGRWMPDTPNTSTEYTDYVWSPRGDEIHFICEEIPSKEHIDLRGSRYFHAIFSKKKEVVIHVDGAIRIFNDYDWEERKGSHVRNCGKIGTRVKVFLIHKKISLEQMINICTNYFVWNYDLIRYFN